MKKQKLDQQKNIMEKLKKNLGPDKQRLVELSCEQGASTWISAVPIAAQGFDLHKSAFRDALCLRYGWQFDGLPSSCVCGNKFTTNHALICHTGGYPTIRHNEVRDFTANLLSEVCHNVSREPCLQPITQESF